MLTLLPDLNVAPLKYAHVHREHGGPVHSLSFVERTLPEGVFHEAFAYLEPKCVGDVPGPHGTGFAATKADAVHSAVSDAMAYWAWASASRDDALRKSLRLDLDPSRHGFAAFPGLGLQGAHKRALFAAAEKWNLCAWWESQITHTALQAPGVTAIQLRTPIVGVSTVITWEERGGGAIYGIGTGAAPSLAHAAARVSLLRARQAEHPTPRQRYLTSAAGYADFKARVAGQGPRIPPAAPKPIVDAGVTGPWTQYAHVWRCLFDLSGFRERSAGDEYFCL